MKVLVYKAFTDCYWARELPKGILILGNTLTSPSSRLQRERGKHQLTAPSTAMSTRRHNPKQHFSCSKWWQRPRHPLYGHPTQQHLAIKPPCIPESTLFAQCQHRKALRSPATLQVYARFWLKKAGIQNISKHPNREKEEKDFVCSEVKTLQSLC